MIKCFTKNKAGKIEFTEKELEKLLNEIYKSGYDEANSKHYWWYSPYTYTTTTASCSNSTPTISGVTTRNFDDSATYASSSDNTMDCIKVVC